MDVIACDALVAVGGGWVPCDEQTTPERTAGWTFTREGGFCPRHSSMVATSSGRAA